MTTEKLLDFLKFGMGTAEQVSDELLRQFFNYLLVSTLLHAATVALVTWFGFASLSRLAKSFADDTVSRVWARGVGVLRSALVVASIIYSYHSIAPVIEPLVAPHVWLIKQGVKLYKAKE